MPTTQVAPLINHELQKLLKTLGQVAASDRQTVEVSCRSAATAAKLLP
jgi:hypothetical protein